MSMVAVCSEPWTEVGGELVCAGDVSNVLLSSLQSSASFLPPLSAADFSVLLAGMLSLWSVAYGIRMLKRVIGRAGY